MNQRDLIKKLKSEVTLEVAKERNEEQEKTAWFCDFSEMSVNDRGFDTVQDAIELYMEKILTKVGITLNERY